MPFPDMTKTRFGAYVLIDFGRSVSMDGTEMEYCVRDESGNALAYFHDKSDAEIFARAMKKTDKKARQLAKRLEKQVPQQVTPKETLDPLRLKLRKALERFARASSDLALAGSQPLEERAGISKEYSEAWQAVENLVGSFLKGTNE